MNWTVDGAMRLGQLLQLLVTVGLAVLGYMITRQQNEFNEAITQIETQLKLKQENRAESESIEKLRFQLFTQVTATLEKKENTERQSLAAKALVVSLLRYDDPLRIGLLEALTTAADPQTKEKLEKVTSQERAYRAEDDAVGSVVDALQRERAGQPGNALQGYLVDVFYCAKDEQRFRKPAAALGQALKDEAIKFRLRVLEDTVNASPGMRVSGYQLRYNDDELKLAQQLQAKLKSLGQGDFTLRQVRQSTPNYLSVFLCS